MKMLAVLMVFMISFLSFSTLATSATTTTTTHQDAPKCLPTFVEADRKSFWNKGGAYNQFKLYHLVINIKLGLQLNNDSCTSLTLDKIKRVGFMGTINNEPVTLIGEYGPLLYVWGFSFDLSNGLSYDSFKTAKGAFFVETNDNNYYWIKQKNGQDYVFNQATTTDVLYLDSL